MGKSQLHCICRSCPKPQRLPTLNYAVLLTQVSSISSRFSVILAMSDFLVSNTRPICPVLVMRRYWLGDGGDSGSRAPRAVPLRSSIQPMARHLGFDWRVRSTVLPGMAAESRALQGPQVAGPCAHGRCQMRGSCRWEVHETDGHRQPVPPRRYLVAVSRRFVFARCRRYSAIVPAVDKPYHVVR